MGLLSDVFKSLIIIYFIYYYRRINKIDLDKQNIKFLQKNSAEFTLFLNKNQEFPLHKPCKVLLIGSGARFTAKGGLGSGLVDTEYFTTCEEGLEKANFILSKLSKKWLDDYSKIKQNINNTKEHLNYLTELFNKNGQNGVFASISFPEI